MLLMYKRKDQEDWKAFKEGNREEIFERKLLLEAVCPEFDFRIEMGSNDNEE